MTHETSTAETDRERSAQRSGRLFSRPWDAAKQFVSHRTHALLLAYLALYTIFGALTVGFYPTYAWPGGDEAAFYNWALHPWTLVGDMFEGYPPMELTDPYAPRVFLLPFSMIFSLFGFTVIGARLVIFAYGLVLLFVTYLIGCHVTSRSWSLVCVLLLSWSPQFVAHTHVVRQECLLTLAIMIGVWLIVRCGDRVDAKTLFWLGAIGTGSVMVHYNGIVLAPIFCVAAVTYDFHALAWRKLRWLAVGCGVAAAVFLLVDFLPGLEKIRVYGILPVTYGSQSRIPLLQGSRFGEMVVYAIREYSGYFRGWNVFEPRTAWFTAALLVPAVFGLCYRSGRKERLLGITILLLFVALITIIPNVRYRYLFYLCPLVFLLAVVGLGKLPASLDMRLLSSAFVLMYVGVYGYEVSRELRQAWAYHVANKNAAKTLRKMIADIGDPSEVTVMGPLRLHECAYGTRFRGFFSLIYTRDFEVSLRELKPDIVILYPPSTDAMVSFMFGDLPVRRNESSEAALLKRTRRWAVKGLLKRLPNGDWVLNPDAVREQLFKDLELAGYKRKALSRAKWNGDPLDFYVKRSTNGA